jgi:hypothetical protein
MGVDAIITPSSENGHPPDSGANGQADPSPTDRPDAERTPALTKVTLYVRPEQVLAIEEIQVRERRRTGRRRDKSELIQEALDLLIERYGELVKQ